MDSGKFDKLYPHIVATLVGVGYFVFMSFSTKFVLHPNLKELFTASATISSIAVGFLATAKATLLSINRSRVVKWMKDGGVYVTMIDYCMTAVHYCLFTTVFSALLLLMDFKKVDTISITLVSVWVFFAVGSLLTGYRIIRLYSYVLRKN
jgi:hypothetical protein